MLGRRGGGGGSCGPLLFQIVQEGLSNHLLPVAAEVGQRSRLVYTNFPSQITQLKIASNPFAKGFRDCDPEDW